MSMPIGISEDLALRATPKTARRVQCALTEKFHVSDLGWEKKYFEHNPKILHFGMFFVETCNARER